MNYLKSLFFNFLIVFFSNHLLPGIDVVVQKKLPHVGGDLLFAIGLGVLNSLIYPVLKILNKSSHMFLQILLASLLLNFGAYALLKLLPFGIHISSWEGYLVPAIAVTIVSVLTNYLEMKAHPRHQPPFIPPDEPPPANM